METTVLHLIETGGPGGAERMMVHLASGLGDGYRSEAALIRDSWLGGALKDRGVPVTMLRYTRSSFLRLFELDTLRDLLGLIRKKNVNILHTHEFLMNTIGLVASRLAGVPLVATVHGTNYYGDRFRRRVAYRLVGRFAHQMVAVSEDLKRFLADQINIHPDRIQVVRNGVPIGEQPSPEKLSTLRQDLSLDRHTRVVGTVGSLYPVKGHRYLIDAAASVIDRFPHVVFLIVGRGNLREELEAQAQRQGVAAHFRFLGHRDDVRDILALCEVFVLPSLSEGMPLALLEAMAAGVPAVATQVGGINEVLEDGKTGLLVPAADSQQLAESIITLLNDRVLRVRMGAVARESVASCFSLNRMVEAYENIYADLISKVDPARGGA
ncbi:MAG: glycosyltransferase [Candidatus Methylomirabilales bacterium]